MISIKEIINICRHSLNDTEQQRWSDERLVILLNDALLNISLNFDYPIRRGFITLDQSGRMLALNRVVRLIDAHYDNELIPFRTVETMNAQSLRWMEDTGDRPYNIVIGRQNAGELMIYPKVDIREDQAGMSNSAPPQGAVNLITGVYVEDEGMERPSYVDFTYIERWLNYEVNSEETVIPEDNRNIYYSNPNIVDQANNAAINTEYDFIHCLKHYIVAMCFRDNSEDVNQNRANQELQVYQYKLGLLRMNKATEYTSNHRFETGYNPFGHRNLRYADEYDYYGTGARTYSRTNYPYTKSRR